MTFNEAQNKFMVGVVGYIALGVTACIGILISLDKKQAVLESKVETHNSRLDNAEKKIAEFELRLTRVEYEQDRGNRGRREFILPMDAILPSGNTTQKKRNTEDVE